MMPTANGTKPTLRVDGALKLFNATVFLQKLKELFAHSSESYCLDLQNVKCMSSVFIGYIIEQVSAMSQAGATITIILQPQLASAFKAVGVDQFADIVEVKS